LLDAVQIYGGLPNVTAERSALLFHVLSSNLGLTWDILNLSGDFFFNNSK